MNMKYDRPVKANAGGPSTYGVRDINMKRSYSTTTLPSSQASTIVLTPARKKRKTSKKTVIFTVPKKIDAFPISRKQVLRYCDTIVLDPGAGGIASNFFSVNGMYDPDTTLGGHQPYGFDQWTAIYKYWHILSSKISIQVAAASTGTTQAWRVGITPINRTSAVPSNAVDLMEMDGTVFNMYERYNTIKLYKKQDSHKTFGIKDIMDADEMRGTITGNPPTQSYWMVWVANGNQGVVDPEPLSLNITIDYECVFTDANQPLNS